MAAALAAIFAVEASVDTYSVATAAAVWLARNGKSKEDIQSYIDKLW